MRGSIAALGLLVAACSGAASAGNAADAGDAGAPDAYCQKLRELLMTPCPPDAVPAHGSGATFAISHLYLGTTDRDGNPSTSAWKDYGFNLDGLISSKTDTNHCALVTGANPTNVKQDGRFGIDNSFGGNLLTLLTTLEPTFEDDVNAHLSSGATGYVIRLDNLGAEKHQIDVRGTWFRAGPTNQKPVLDGSDVWPIWNDPVEGGSFDKSYVVDGTWVSLEPLTIVLPIPVTPDPQAQDGGVPDGGTTSQPAYALPLVIHQAELSMQLAPDGATQGTIGGVLGADEAAAIIVGFIRVWAQSNAVCISQTRHEIAAQIRQASDIMADGTNGDPSQQCDGISIGLGFDAVRAHVGSSVDPPPAPPACP